MSDTITTLEARATAAEAQLKKLNETVTALQKGAGSTASAAGSTDNAATVTKLKALQSVLLEDQKEAETVRAHRDELKEENEKLRLQLEKAEYRIKHLLRTIAELEQK